MVLQTSYMMDILLMEAGGAWVLSWMLGWAVTDPRRFPGPAYGFWVPPPPPLVFGGGPSHACLSPWAPSSWLPSPSTAYCYLQVPGSRVWSILPCGRVISGGPSPPPGLCHPGHSISSPSLWTWPSPIHHLPHLHHPRFGLIWPPGPCTW